MFARLLIYTALIIALSIAGLGYDGALAQTPTPTAPLPGVPFTASSSALPRQLARLGRGRINSAAWSADGKTLAVATMGGLWVYALDNPTALPRLFSGDTDWIADVIVTQDGKTLAGLHCGRVVLNFTCDLQKLQLWDVASGKPIGEPRLLHPYHTTALAVNIAGDTLATGGCEALDDNGSCKAYALRFWRLPNLEPAGEPIFEIGYPDSLAFSPNGDIVAAGVYGKLMIFKVGTGKVIASLKDSSDTLSGNIKSIAFSPDGSRVTASGGSTIVTWDVGKAAQINAIPAKGFAGGISYNRDRILVGWGYASESSTIQLQNVLTGARLASVSYGPDEGVAFISLSPDGNTLLTHTFIFKAAFFSFWDTHTGTLLDSFYTSNDLLGSVFRPEGSALVLFYRVSDGVAYLLSITGKQEKVIFAEPASPYPADVAFSQDGTRVAFLTSTGIAVRDTKSGAVLARFKEAREIQQIAVNANGSLLAAASHDEAFVWDMKTSAPLLHFKGKVAGLALSPDSTTLALADSTGNVQLWNLKTQASGIKLEGSVTGGVQAANLLFSPDGTRLIFSMDQTENAAVQFWNTQTGTELATFDDKEKSVVREILFSADSTRLALRDRNLNTLLLDAQTGKQIVRLDPGTFTFSPDSALLLSGNLKGIGQVWDARTGALIAEWQAHTSEVNALAFNNSGTWLVSGSEDGTVRIWGTG